MATDSSGGSGGGQQKRGTALVGLRVGDRTLIIGTMGSHGDGDPDSQATIKSHTPIAAKDKDYKGTDASGDDSSSSSSSDNNIRHPTDGYGAEYPYNHVAVYWPSGMEKHYDNTKGKERIRQAHMPSGTYTETKPDGRTVESHTADHCAYHKGGVCQTFAGADNSGGGGGGAGQGGGSGNNPNPGNAGGNWDLKVGDAKLGGSVRHEFGGGKYADMGGGKGSVIGGHEKKIVGGSKTGTNALAIGGHSITATKDNSVVAIGGIHTIHINGAKISITNEASTEKVGGARTETNMDSKATSVKKDSEKKIGGNEKKSVGGSSSHKNGGDNNQTAGGTHSTKGKNVNHDASQSMAMKAGQAISMLSKLMSMGSGSGGGGGGGGGAGSGGGQMAANDSGISIGQGNNSVAANTTQITTIGNVVVNDLLLVNGNTTINATFTVNGTATINGTAIFKAAVAEQGYDLPAVVNNFFYVVPNNVSLVVLNIPNGFGKGTITMPSSPIDGQKFRVTCANSIATLTINANSGQAVLGPPTQMNSNTPFGFAWVNSLATWFRV